MAYTGLTVRTITESDINGQTMLDSRFEQFGTALVIRLKTDKTLEIFSCSADDPALDSMAKSMLLEKEMEE